MRRIRKYVNIFKSTILWTRALQSASYKKYDESLFLLESIYSTLSIAIPSEKSPYEINILTSFVANKLGDYELSIRSAAMVLAQMKGTSNGLTENDKIYLRYYCKILIDNSEYFAGVTLPNLNRAKIDTEYQNLNLARVRSHIKSKFPVKVANSYTARSDF
jgi:hypothetical protein